MNSNERTIGQLFHDPKWFRVPLYQRHYVWDRINWGHLWDDIEEKSDLRRTNNAKAHFTGAIVIQESERIPLAEIIDGQQRLTTFQIILCAIRDTCSEFDDPMDLKNRVRNFIYIPTGARLTPDPIEQYRLLPREGADRIAFQALVENEEVKSDGRILETYQYFKKEIEKYVDNNYDKLHNLYNSILTDFMVVEITVRSDDEYAKIFKSINGTGRRLDQFDLLRNDLFLRARGTERDNLYRTYWYHFEEDSNWRKPGVVDDFLANFLKVKLGEDFDDQLSLFDLYELYCTKLAKELNLSETNAQLVRYEFDDLSRYSHIYHDMRTPHPEKIGGRMKFYTEFNDQLNVVDQMKLSILYMTNEFRLSTCELTRIFNLFESYVVRGMLNIGSKGYNSPPLEGLKRLLLRAIEQDGKKSLSLVDLIHLLFSEWVSDQDVKVALDRLPKTEAARKKSKSNLMREFGGTYIFNVLGWTIDRNQLFDKFCEKWPSAEVMLHKELIGELPIVYSRSLISAETIDRFGFDSESHVSAQMKPQPECYAFVTYKDTRELLEYKTNKNCIVGSEINNERNETVTLDSKEILFAFSTTAIYSSSNPINRIREDIKNLGLEPVSKQETFSTKDWLFDEIPELQPIVENSNFEHWLLSNPEVITVVTRAGHELQGTLKSFNNTAIYLEINGQTVTVYSHGIYKLERRKKTDNKKGRK